jgi:preprotein translocase subunit SecG
MSSRRLFPLALVSALLLSPAVLAQGGGGGGGGGGGAGAGAGAGGAVLVVPVEVLARAVLPA